MLHLNKTLLALALLAACGPGSGTTDTAATTTLTTGADSTGPGASSTPGTEPTTEVTTGGPTSAPDPTTGETATSEPNPVSETIPESTTLPGTSTGEPGTETGEPGTSTGGEPGPVECVADADCKLHDDCCTCEGVPVDEEVVFCDLDCRQSKCSELGIEAAVCRLGVCETGRLSCNGAKVLCDALPPECPPGQVAETSPNCWTGRCVPAELCDVVPSCLECPDGRLCVENIGRGPSGWPRCEPVPPACGGEVTCACLGESLCEDPFSFCAVQSPAVVHCECPNC